MCPQINSFNNHTTVEIKIPRLDQCKLQMDPFLFSKEVDVSFLKILPVGKKSISENFTKLIKSNEFLGHLLRF